MLSRCHCKHFLDWHGGRLRGTALRPGHPLQDPADSGFDPHARERVRLARPPVKSHGAVSKGGRRRTQYLLCLLGLVLVSTSVVAILNEGGGRRARSPQKAPSTLAPELGEGDRSRPGVESPSPAGVEPVPEVEAETLPPVFFGDIHLTGFVKDPSGTRVRGAEVRLIPGNFEPSNLIELDRFRTVSGPEGVFAFERFPVAPFYYLSAHTTASYGAEVVRAEQLEDKPLEMVVKPLYYERLAFVDPSGRPVDVRGVKHAPWGKPVWTTAWERPGPERHRLATMGVRLDRLGFHEIATIYASRRMLRRASGDGEARVPPYRFEIPGYEPVEVGPFRWPLARWPQARSVVLRATRLREHEVRYVFEFPAAKAPGAWGRGPGGPADDFRLRVQLVGSPYSRLLARRRNVLFAPRDAHFEIKQAKFESLIPYDLEPTPQGTRVRPRYPSYGFLTVRFEIPARGGPMQDVLRIFVTPPGSLQARVLFPGLARVGPLPEGEYTFTLLWKAYDGHFASETLAPVVVRKGHREIRWR